MANITGSFSSDGVSTGYAYQGNIDCSIKIVGSANSGNAIIEVSYDGGTTWYPLEGGNMGNHSNDKVIISGSATTQYRFRARGVAGSIPYFMGAE